VESYIQQRMKISLKISLMVKYHLLPFIFTYCNLFYHVIILDFEFQVLMSVARERRRGDRPPTKNVIWEIYI